MKISWKIASILAVTTLLTMGIAFGTLAALASKDYLALEEEVVRQDLALVEDAMQDDLRALEASAGQTIAISNALFVGGPQGDENASFDIGLSLFAVHDLDLMMFSSTNATSTFSMGFTLDAETRTFQTFDEAFGDEMRLWLAMAAGDPLRPLSAIVQDNGTWYMVAAQAWSPGYGNASISLGVGRIISETYAQSLSAQTGLQVGFSVQEGGAWAPSSGPSIDRDPSWVTITDTIAASSGDALVLEVSRDRTLYQSGIQGLMGVAAGAAIAAFGVVGLAIWLVDRFVTGRVLRLSKAVVAQDVDHLDKDARGRDEVAELVRRFQASERALRHSNENLDAFAGIVSHDLRSPLTTVALNATLVAQSNPHQAARIRRAVEAMDTRIVALLRYARSGGRPQMRDVDTDLVIRNVLADLEGDLRQRRARVRRKGLPRLQADHALLSDAVQNLVQNALKYGKEQPSLHIYARQHGGRVGIAIQDDGPGFAPADVERMLKPMERLDNARGIDGAGLGLATVHRLVRSMGGELQAEGRPGRGARFTIWLAPASG